MKLQHLAYKKFIGDMSLQDADLLCYLTQYYDRIFEFGIGGSTQLFAQCNPHKLICVETDQGWIDLTKARLAKLGDVVHPKFHGYQDVDIIVKNEKFNFVFVDGVDNLRLDFAIKAWPALEHGGIMVFHDTRRAQDFRNAAWIAQLHFDEISAIEVNHPASDGQRSNLTIIYKEKQLPYVNWNYTENKPLSAYSVPGTNSFEFWSQT